MIAKPVASGAMNRVTPLRHLAHAAAAGVALVCAVQAWITFVLRPTESGAQINASIILEWVQLVAGVVFIAWLGRARRNLLDFKGEARAYSPGWTIGAWFVPIANLIMPALVTADVARGSTTDPATKRKLLTLVWLWWPCYVGNAVALFGRYSTDPFHPALVIATVSYLAAGVLVTALMYAINDAQRTRFSSLSELDPSDFPAFTVEDVHAAEAARQAR